MNKLSTRYRDSISCENLEKITFVNFTNILAANWTISLSILYNDGTIKTTDVSTWNERVIVN